MLKLAEKREARKYKTKKAITLTPSGAALTTSAKIPKTNAEMPLKASGRWLIQK